MTDQKLMSQWVGRSILSAILLYLCLGLEGTQASDRISSNKQVVRLYFEEIWNRRQLDQMDRIFAEDFIAHHLLPGGSPSRSGLRRQIESALAAFPDSATRIDDMIAEENRVAVRWLAMGTHEGPYLGREATRRVVSVSGISIFLLRDGKIQEKWLEWDIAGLIRQLDQPPAIIP